MDEANYTMGLCCCQVNADLNVCHLDLEESDDLLSGKANSHLLNTSAGLNEEACISDLPNDQITPTNDPSLGIPNRHTGFGNSCLPIGIRARGNRNSDVLSVEPFEKDDDFFKIIFIPGQLDSCNQIVPYTSKAVVDDFLNYEDDVLEGPV